MWGVVGRGRIRERPQPESGYAMPSAENDL